MTLLEIRKERGLSQKEVSKAIGIAPSMLSMLESGERYGSDHTKILLANYYGLTVQELFFADKTTKCDKKQAKRKEVSMMDIKLRSKINEYVCELIEQKNTSPEMVHAIAELVKAIN